MGIWFRGTAIMIVDIGGLLTRALVLASVWLDIF